MADQATRHGHPAEAVTLIETAMFDDSFARDQQIYWTHLAETFARPGKQRDFDAAVDQGLAAMHMAESLTSSRGIECLHDLYRQMQPHASTPTVSDFLERLRGVLGANGIHIGFRYGGATSGFHYSSRCH